MIDKRPSFQPVTLADPKPDLDPRAQPLPFTLTQSDKTRAAIVRCDIERMRRAFRCPEGLEVGEATQAEWDEAVRKFRVTL